MTPPNQPALTLDYPDAIVAGAMASYDADPYYTDRNGERVADWEGLSQDVKDRKCRAFAAGLGAVAEGYGQDLYNEICTADRAGFLPNQTFRHALRYLAKPLPQPRTTGEDA